MMTYKAVPSPGVLIFEAWYCLQEDNLDSVQLFFPIKTINKAELWAAPETPECTWCRWWCPRRNTALRCLAAQKSARSPAPTHKEAGPTAPATAPEGIRTSWRPRAKLQRKNLSDSVEININRQQSKINREGGKKTKMVTKQTRTLISATSC